MRRCDLGNGREPALAPHLASVSPMRQQRRGSCAAAVSPLPAAASDEDFSISRVRVSAQMREARDLLGRAAAREGSSAALLASLEALEHRLSADAAAVSEREARLAEREASASHKEAAFARRVAAQRERVSAAEASEEVQLQLRRRLARAEDEVRRLSDGVTRWRDWPRSDAAVQASVEAADAATQAQAPPLAAADAEVVVRGGSPMRGGPWQTFTNELLKGLAQDAILGLDAPVPTSPLPVAHAARELLAEGGGGGGDAPRARYAIVSPPRSSPTRVPLVPVLPYAASSPRPAASPPPPPPPPPSLPLPYAPQPATAAAARHPPVQTGAGVRGSAVYAPPALVAAPVGGWT